MKKALLALLLVLVAAPVLAQEVTCEIIDYGILEPEGKVVNVTKEYNQKTVRHKTAKLLKQTDRFKRSDMPFKFGFHFMLHGPSSKEAITLTVVTYHPRTESGWAAKDKPLKSSNTSRAGKVSYHYTNLEKDSHYVPGEWTTQVVYNGKILCSKTFYLE